MNNKLFFLQKIYRVILLIVVLLCLVGLIIIPVNVYDRSSSSGGVKIQPADCEQIDSMTRDFHLRNLTWDSNASCLRFSISHQEVSVTADGVLLYERKITQTTFGHTTGWGWVFVDIPTGTKEVVVTVTACYSEFADSEMVFYQGNGTTMQQALLRGSLFSAIICFLNIIIGYVMILYWIIAHKKAQIGYLMIYLGVFAVLLGTWSLLETNFAQIMFINWEAWSFVSPICLMLMSIPFMLFFHDYLQDDNPYLCPILISASLVQSLVVLILHFTKIAYMRETLLSTHIMMAVALGYLIITFCRTLRKHKLRSQVRVSAVGMSVLSIAFIADMVAYSYHVNDSDMFGRIGFFIFILVLGVDATAASQREIEAGRKAMLYKELAEKDMLTNCYNRNSYLDDISGDKLEDGLLLVTFDLNNLKYYNDTFGHACGDQYLMDSATIMQEVFGSIGKLYRIGGDEFCVLIEPKTRCDIKQLLDEFIRQQERYNELPGQIHLQIACGYAQYHADSDADLEATRERADIRMYENKRALKGCEPR